MKKLLTIQFLIGSMALLCHAEEFYMRDLSGGMYSNASANMIPDNSANLIQNMYTDIEPICVERNGYIKKEVTVLGGAKPVTALCRFVDTSANEWLIAFSSRTYYKSKSGTNFTAFGPLSTVDQAPTCASNLGKVLFANGTDQVWSYDGASTAAISGAPLGKVVVAWRTRFAIGAITGSASTVRFSADGDATSWTLGGNPTDPFSIQIGGANDGFGVLCMSSYLDNLIISRKYDTWSLSGFDQADVELRNVSKEVGCLQHQTMAERDNALYWLSNRGVEEMRGITITNISDPIRDLTDPIAKNASRSLTYILTSMSDWDAGTQNPLGFAYTARTAGDLQAGATDFTLTSYSDWNAGSYVDSNATSPTAMVNTGDQADKLGTRYPDPFDSFLVSTVDESKNWYPFTNTGTTITVSGGYLTMVDSATAGGTSHMAYIKTLQAPTRLSAGVTFYYEIKDVDTAGTGAGYNGFGFMVNDSNQTDSTPFNFGCNYSHLVSTSGIVSGLNADALNPATCPNLETSTITIGTPFNVTLWMSETSYSLRITGSSGSAIRNGSHTYSSANPYFYMVIGTSFGTSKASPSDPFSFRIDKVGIAPQDFTWTSPALNTGITTPTWDTVTISTTDPIGALSFQTQSSADGSTWDTAASITSGNKPTSSKQRYLRTIMTVNHSSYSGTPSSMADFTAGAWSSGTWTSAVIDTGGNATSWGTVQITKNDSLSKANLFFNTSDSSVFVSSDETSISNNQQPSNPVRRYAIFRSSFTISESSHTSILNSIVLNWAEGSVQPFSSAVYDRRYWLSFSTAGSFNNKVIVYQRNNSWTLLDGINAASYAIWGDKLHSGNSDSTGLVYEQDNGNNDDGANITSILKTKSYDLGAFHREKDLRYVYPNWFGSSSYSGTFSLTYDLDRSGSSYALGSGSLSEGTGQLSPRFPFPLTLPVQGREVQYTLTKTGIGNRLRLNGFVTSYQLKEER